MTFYYLSENFVVINIGRRCNSCRYYPAVVINTTMIFVAQRAFAVFTAYACIRISRVNTFVEFVLLVIVKLFSKLFAELAQLWSNFIDVSISVYGTGINMDGFAVNQAGIYALFEDIHEKRFEYFRAPAIACLGQYAVIRRGFVKIVITEP